MTRSRSQGNHQISKLLRGKESSFGFKNWNLSANIFSLKLSSPYTLPRFRFTLSIANRYRNSNSHSLVFGHPEFACIVLEMQVNEIWIIMLDRIPVHGKMP